MNGLSLKKTKRDVTATFLIRCVARHGHCAHGASPVAFVLVTSHLTQTPLCGIPCWRDANCGCDLPTLLKWVFLWYEDFALPSAFHGLQINSWNELCEWSVMPKWVEAVKYAEKRHKWNSLQSYVWCSEFVSWCSLWFRSLLLLAFRCLTSLCNCFLIPSEGLNVHVGAEARAPRRLVNDI